MPATGLSVKVFSRYGEVVTVKMDREGTTSQASHCLTMITRTASVLRSSLHSLTKLWRHSMIWTRSSFKVQKSFTHSAAKCSTARSQACLERFLQSSLRTHKEQRCVHILSIRLSIHLRVCRIHTGSSLTGSGPATAYGSFAPGQLRYTQ